MIFIFIGLCITCLFSCTNQTSSYEDYVDYIRSTPNNSIYLYGNDIAFDNDLDSFVVNDLDFSFNYDKTNYLIINFDNSISNISTQVMAKLERLSKRGVVLVYIQMNRYGHSIIASEYDIFYIDVIDTLPYIYLFDGQNEYTNSTDYTDDIDFTIVHFIYQHQRMLNARR